MKIDITFHRSDGQAIIDRLGRIENTLEVLMGKAEDASAALSRVESELEETKMAVSDALARAQQDAATARAIADELQAKVDAGDTEFADLATRATAVADGMDALQSSLAPVAPPTPTPDTPEG